MKKYPDMAVPELKDLAKKAFEDCEAARRLDPGISTYSLFLMLAHNAAEVRAKYYPTEATACAS